MTITKGDRVFFKPEYSEPGDENWVYVAHDEPEKGRVAIRAANSSLTFPPINIVRLCMLVGGDEA